MSTQTKFPKQTILGVEIDNLSIAQAVEHIVELSVRPGCRYIAKPYVEYLDAASRNEQLQDLLNNAYLSLPDGVSLNWATYFTRRTKGRLMDVLTSLFKIIFRPLELHLGLPNYSWGTNFTWSLLEACAQAGRTVFLVGSPKSSHITATREFLESKIPGLIISGSFEGKDPRTGQFSDKFKEQLTLELKSRRPDVVLVAIGFPAQERLNAELQQKLDHGVLIGEGGTFDFVTFGGRIPKAPSFMQQRGLEWFWRLLREPVRFRRQLSIPRFIWQVYARKP